MEDYDPAAHYDRVTEAWGLVLGDELHYGLFATGQESLSEATSALTGAMIDAARLEPGMRVLDVGCGSGAPACRLSEDHAVEVLGITTSAVGVGAANGRAQARGLARMTRFEQRDGTATGLPGTSFDRVWVMESSHLMSDRAALVNECARVLNPGGRMVLCDLVRRRDIPFLELRQKRREFAVLRAAFGAARMDPLDEYVRLAGLAGLEVDLAQDLTEATRPTFERWKCNLDAHRAEVTEILGRQSVGELEESLHILDGFWADGTLGYGIVAATRVS